MAESDSLNVYDLFYPSPPALKELASIEVALDLWRREIIKYRTNNTLDHLDLKSNLPLSTIFPNIPTVILLSIEKFSKRVGPSIESWLKFHIDKGLLKFEVLNDFVDFVCDFDGTIHYAWTAKRLLCCDGISDVVKFEIACRNCFEDDILKIWPSVSSHMDLNNIKLHSRPLIYYWICRLKNQLYKISLPANCTIEEKLLSMVYDYWPSTKYFLNRLNYNTFSKNSIECFNYRVSSNDSCRYLLQKLNEADLQTLISRTEGKFWELFIPLLAYENKIRRTWSYIKHVTTKGSFNQMMRSYLLLPYSSETLPKEVSSYCEIWASAPDHLKQSLISSLISNNFNIRTSAYGKLHCSDQSTLLLAILSDASIEQRKEFWDKNWRLLIGNLEMLHLRRLMNLCFSNETDLEQFKAAEMSNYETIKPHCRILFMNGRFQCLNEFLTFCCPDEKTVKDFKLRFLGRRFNFINALFEQTDALNQFIDDSYGPDVDLANTFKTQLFSCGNLSLCLKDCMTNGRFRQVMHFVSTFAVTEQIAEDFKKREIVPLVQSFFTTSSFAALGASAVDDLSMFMSWLLGDDEKTAEFKQTLRVDDVVQNQIRIEMERSQNKIAKDCLGRRVRSPPAYNYFLIKFLEWYFVTDEAMEEFKAMYADDDVFVRLITK